MPMPRVSTAGDCCSLPRTLCLVGTTACLVPRAPGFKLYIVGWKLVMVGKWRLESYGERKM